MNVSLLSPRTLDAAGGLFTLLALVLLVLPARSAERPVARNIPAVRIAAPRGTDTSDVPLGRQIVDGNAFSSTRRAPTVRFIPPGTEPASAQSTAAQLALTSMSDNGVTAMPDTPKLFGIVAQDGRRRALLQLPGADSVPRLLEIGDRRGGYRVVSISDDRVVLASSTGSRTLRLVSRTSPDSLENLP